MFCPNCGKELAKGAKFCTFCGQKIDAYGIELSKSLDPKRTNTEVDTEQPSHEIGTLPEMVQVEGATEQEMTEPYRRVSSSDSPVEPDANKRTQAQAVHMPGNHVQQMGPRAGMTPPVRKYGHTRRVSWLFAALAALVVAGTLLGIVRNKADENPIFYIADSGARLAKSTDTAQDDIIEVTSGRADNITQDDYVVFSPDGKYVYFYSRFDSSKRTGTLSKAEWGKLKKNGKGNSKYIEIIDKEVERYTVLENGNVVYCTSDPALYYFNGKESVMVMEGDFLYEPSGENGLLFYDKIDDDDIKLDGVFVAAPHLYYVDVASPTNVILLSENVYPFCTGTGSSMYVESSSDLIRMKFNDYYNDLIITNNADDANNIIISKMDDDIPKLFSVGINKNPVPIDEISAALYADGDTVYYVRQTSEEIEVTADYSVPNVELCSYSDGKSTVLDSALWNWTTLDGAILYGKYYDVQSQENEDFEHYSPLFVCITADGSLHELSDSIVMELNNHIEDTPKFDCYVCGDSLYFGMPDKTIWRLPIEDGLLNHIECIATDGELYGCYNGTVYYVSNVYSNNGYTYCDLCSYKNGQTECLAEYILYDDIYIYEDGTIFVTRDFDYRGYDLYMVTPDAAPVKVSSRVTRFSRLKNKDLVYVASDALYVFDGKKSNAIDTNAEWFAALNTMQPTNLNIAGNKGADYGFSEIPTLAG